MWSGCVNRNNRNKIETYTFLEKVHQNFQPSLKKLYEPPSGTAGLFPMENDINIIITAVDVYSFKIYVSKSKPKININRL